MPSEQFNVRLSELHSYALRRLTTLTGESIGSYLERAAVLQIEQDIKTKMPEKWDALRREMENDQQAGS